MKPIKIQLTFENCESVVIPIEHVYSFTLGNIGKHITYGPHNLDIKEAFCVDRAQLIFNYSIHSFNIQGSTVKPVERITKYMDLSVISLQYEDLTSDTYFVNWPDDYNSYENANQNFEDDGKFLTINIKNTELKSDLGQIEWGEITKPIPIQYSPSGGWNWLEAFEHDYIKGYCPIGEFLIEWKDFRGYDERSIFFNGKRVNSASTTEEAKKLAFEHYEKLIKSCYKE